MQPCTQHNMFRCAHSTCAKEAASNLETLLKEEERWAEPAKPTRTKQVFANGFWRPGRDWMQQPIESQLFVWKHMTEDETCWFFHEAELIVKIAAYGIGSRFAVIEMDTTESTLTVFHTDKDFKTRKGETFSLILTVGERL